MSESTSEPPKKIDVPPPEREDPTTAAREPGPRPEELDEREARVLERDRKPMGPPPEEGEGPQPEAEEEPPDVPPTSPEPA
jgi:hypothetical protein